jgi:hypothetical protein
VGPARQPHCPNNGAAVLTAYRPRLLPCPPMVSPPFRPPFRPPFPPPSATASCGYKRSARPKSFPFSSPSTPALPLLSSLFTSATTAPDADKKLSLLSPNHRLPHRSCASFLLEQDRPQATAPRVAEEMAAVQSPIHRASPPGQAAPTVPRGHLRCHDLRAGALGCSSTPLQLLPPLGLCHHGTPHSSEPSPLFSRQSSPSPHRLALRPLPRRRWAGFHRQVVGANRVDDLP